MSQKNRADLYEEFKNGDIPNENDFADTIDSALNLVEDGLISYKVITPVGEVKRFGMGGETAPDCPLGIKGEPEQDDKMICFTSNDEAQKWNINLHPHGDNKGGFSIDDVSAGIGESRLFIDHETKGNIGINTVLPNQKLHVSGTSPGGHVSILVENLDSGKEQGWMASAINDNSVAERMNTFAIQERNSKDSEERITIISFENPPGNPIKNVGINEVLPSATLHATKPISDPLEPVAMHENTGILCLGQIDSDNLAMDSHRIQGRHGDYIPGSSTLQLIPSQLALQPFGGGLTVNGESSVTTEVVTVESDGKVGVGGASTEKLTVNGAVAFGDTNTATPPDGTVRWSGTNNDLEVWKDSMWNSLTTHTNTDGLWTDGGAGLIYYNPSGGVHPKVAIGLSQANATLHVKETSTDASSNSGAAIIHNQASTPIADPALSRVALGLKCTGTWNTDPAALNVGLYISDVSGQTEASSNLAALINGNVVMGNVTGNTLVGDNASNVLAIQNGAAPTSIPGLTETTGIQIYSDNVTGNGGLPMSAFHLMTGDGAIMKLYRQPDMTPSDINAPNTGNAVTDALIVNLRTRIDELETIMKTLGLLTP